MDINNNQYTRAVGMMLKRADTSSADKDAWGNPKYRGPATPGPVQNKNTVYMPTAEKIPSVNDPNAHLDAFAKGDAEANRKGETLANIQKGRNAVVGGGRVMTNDKGERVLDPTSERQAARSKQNANISQQYFNNQRMKYMRDHMAKYKNLEKIPKTQDLGWFNEYNRQVPFLFTHWRIPGTVSPDRAAEAGVTPENIRNRMSFWGDAPKALNAYNKRIPTAWLKEFGIPVSGEGLRLPWTFSEQRYNEANEQARQEWANRGARKATEQAQQAADAAFKGANPTAETAMALHPRTVYNMMPTQKGQMAMENKPSAVIRTPSTTDANGIPVSTAYDRTGDQLTVGELSDHTLNRGEAFAREAAKRIPIDVNSRTWNSYVDMFRKMHNINEKRLPSRTAWNLQEFEQLPVYQNMLKQLQDAIPKPVRTGDRQIDAANRAAWRKQLEEQRAWLLRQFIDA